MPVSPASSLQKNIYVHIPQAPPQGVLLLRKETLFMRNRSVQRRRRKMPLTEVLLRARTLDPGENRRWSAVDVDLSRCLLGDVADSSQSLGSTGRTCSRRCGDEPLEAFGSYAGTPQTPTCPPGAENVKTIPSVVEEFLRSGEDHRRLSICGPPCNPSLPFGGHRFANLFLIFLFS